MSFSRWIVVVAVDRKDWNRNIDVLIVVVDMVEGTESLSVSCPQAYSFVND